MYIFNDVLDAFRAVGAAAVGAQYELSNPYSLEDNPDQHLYKGWGVIVSEALPAVLDEFKLMSTQHVFSLVFTANATKTDFDATTLTTAIKELYNMERDTRNILMQPNVSGISNAQVTFQNTEAPSFLNPSEETPIGGLTDIVSITSNYLVRIPEPLT